MNITPSDGSLPTAVTRERAVGERDSQHLRWRAELERAQWQERSRYSPARVAARGVPSEQQAAQGVGTRAPTQAAAAAGQAQAAQRAQPTATRDAAPVSRLHASQAQASQRAGASEAPALPTAVALRSHSAVARAPQSRAIPLQLPFELAHWPASATHVCLQGNRLSVVLRDAQLPESEWPRLRERLRSQCEAGGLELAELLINGVPVEPVAPVVE